MTRPVESVVREIAPRGQAVGREYRVACPWREGASRGNVAVNLDTGAWYDHARGEGGSLDDFVLRATGQQLPSDRRPAAGVTEIADQRPRVVWPVPDAVSEPTPDEWCHPSLGVPPQAYQYRDRQGRLLGYVCRWDATSRRERKIILPLWWSPDVGWTWHGPRDPDLRPLYGIDRLRLTGHVLLVEGEKAANAAQRALGDTMPVLSWMGGSANASKADMSPLHGRDVVIWPDADAPGVKAAGEARAALTRAGARSVTVLDVSDIAETSPGWDLADADDWNAARIREEIVARTPKRGELAARISMSSPVGAVWVDYDDKLKPLATLENLEAMLEAYGIGVSYNAITKRTLYTLPGREYSDDASENASIAFIRSLCARNRLGVGRHDLIGYLTEIADRNAINPVADWIDSKPWDGTSRFDDLLNTLTSSSKLLPRLMKAWMVSAVRAAIQGGASHGVLVLQGPQGCGKTSWLESLAPDWIMTGRELNPGSTDSVSTAVSAWIVELGELDATFRRADVAKLKAFLTQHEDVFRRPYASANSRYPRRTVFAASVNPDHFLVDPTGNRRFWTVPVVECDFKHGLDMQQIWAEVATWWRAGEPHWIDRDTQSELEQANEDYRQLDPIEDLIAAKYDWSAPKGARTEWMTAAEVLRDLGYQQPTPAMARTIGLSLGKMTDKRKYQGQRQYQMPQRRRHTVEPVPPGTEHDPF